MRLVHERSRYRIEGLRGGAAALDAASLPPIDAPVLALRAALAARNIDASHFLVPDIGEPVSIP